MTEKQIIGYTLEKVTEGFVSRCATNQKVTSFGKTEEEAGNNLVKSIQEYLELFPEKRDEIFNAPTKIMP